VQYPQAKKRYTSAVLLRLASAQGSGLSCTQATEKEAHRKGNILFFLSLWSSHANSQEMFFVLVLIPVLIPRQWKTRFKKVSILRNTLVPGQVSVIWNLVDFLKCANRHSGARLDAVLHTTTLHREWSMMVATSIKTN